MSKLTYDSYDGTIYYNRHNNYTFLEMYPEATDFINDYHLCELPTTISDDNAKILYYVMVGRKGNDSIRSNSIAQFKYQLYTLIWEYGPYWQKQLEIQEKLRALSDRDVLKGSVQQYNSSANPSQPVTTDVDGHKGTLTTSEVPYLNNQNATINTRSTVDGYSLFADILKMDVSREFFERFDKLFQFMSTCEEWRLYEEEDN